MRVIYPPEPLKQSPFPIVFLAGTIDMNRGERWQDRIISQFEDYNVNFANPRREGIWSGEPVLSNPLFKEQVDWELTYIDFANIVAFYFADGSDSMITLMELGYVAAKRNVPFIVKCSDKYKRQGNVEFMTKRACGEFYTTDEEFVEAIKRNLRKWTEP